MPQAEHEIVILAHRDDEVLGAHGEVPFRLELEHATLLGRRDRRQRDALDEQCRRLDRERDARGRPEALPQLPGRHVGRFGVPRDLEGLYATPHAAHAHRAQGLEAGLQSERPHQPVLIRSPAARVPRRS